MLCYLTLPKLIQYYTNYKSKNFPLYGNMFFLLSMIKVAIMQKVEKLKNIFHVCRLNITIDGKLYMLYRYYVEIFPYINNVSF